MCFVLTGCSEKGNNDKDEKSNTSTGKYNDSLASLFEGYCKVLTGEEASIDVYASLYPQARQESRRNYYPKGVAAGKFNYKECTYEIQFERTESQLKILEAAYSKQDNVQYNLKDCKSIKMFDGEDYHPDVNVCQDSNNKWYIFAG